MLKNKKKIIGTVALCIAGVVLAGTVLAGVTGVQAYAKNTDENTQTEEAKTEDNIDIEETVKDTVENLWQTQHGDGEAYKEETVYVLAEADGSAKEIIVSDWVQNAPEGFDEAATGLMEASAIKSDESGLYYRGISEKKLPVSMTVSYTLDGKEITPEELAGKSGHVVIRYDFCSNRYEMKEINNSLEKIYAPFVTVTGMVLDNARFCNISVSSGKVINDGSRSIVAGIAFPGMADNLNLEEDVLPAYIEVEADVNDFSMEGSYTVAINEVFNGINLEDVDSLEDLKSSMNELTEAADALVNGSSELYDGLTELYKKSGDLKEGVSALADGAGQLSGGAAELNAGAKELQAGADSLSAGLGTLSAKSGELNNGAAQVFRSLLATANSQLVANGLSVPALTIDNYASVLDGILASMGQDGVYQQVYAQVYDAVKAQVESEVKANESAIRAQVTQAVEAQVRAGVLGAAGMTEDEYQALKSAGDAAADAIDASVAAQMQSDGIQQQIAAAVASQEEQLITANINAQMSSQQITDLITQKVTENMPAAESGAAQIAGLKAQLDSYNTFYQGVLSYTAGVSQASAGAGRLSSGAGQLAAGADTLAAGASALKEGTDALAAGSDALIDGVARLKDGAMQLRDGMITFNEEGIEKLAAAFEGDFEELVSRLQAAVELSQEYHSYADSTVEMDGSVRFLYKTAEIK